MNLSPEQKKKVIDAVAKIIADELRAELGGSFASLMCIEMAVVEKMTGLNRKTLRGRLPITELSAGKHAVRLRDLQAYLDSKTVQPLQNPPSR